LAGVFNKKKGGKKVKQGGRKSWSKQNWKIRNSAPFLRKEEKGRPSPYSRAEDGVWRQEGGEETT